VERTHLVGRGHANRADDRILAGRSHRRISVSGAQLRLGNGVRRSRGRHARQTDHAVHFLTVLVDEVLGAGEGKLLVFLRLDRLQPDQVRVAFLGVGPHLSDPGRLVGGSERAGDDGEFAVLTDALDQFVNDGLAEAIERSLVDEPAPGVRLGVGVVADDVDALGQRVTQGGGDGHRVVGGEQDRVHALADVALQELDLRDDIAFGRAVGRGLDIAQLLGSFHNALGSGIEVADADQLGDVHHNNLFAGQVGRVNRQPTVIGQPLTLFGRRLFAGAGQRVGFPIHVGTHPLFFFLGADHRRHRNQNQAAQQQQSKGFLGHGCILLMSRFV